MQGIPSDLTPTFGGDPDDAGIELLAPGTRLSDRYEVRRAIDWGGYAVVYHAHDRELNRDIALKVLRRHRDSKEALIRFRREVAVAREAASPHLVRVFDLETSDGAVYLTMELIDGESLRKRLERGPLPVEAIVRISTEILEALASLHALGIVHRDIKPGNVLIDSTERVKVTDFGLARQLASGDQSATTTGAVLGTLAYISPEQALGGEIDTRSDLYAAGVVMFEMLAGRVPHEAKSALGSLLVRTRRRPVDVRSIRRDCPRWLAQIVLRLLEPRPEDRYEAASDALADLRRRKGRFSPKRVRHLATAAALLVVAGAGFAFSARSWSSRTQFSRFVSEGDGIAAVGRSGETLWRIPRADLNASRYALLKSGLGGKREIAAILLPPGPPSMDRTHTLTFFDPEAGTIRRRVRLPSFASHFRDQPPLYSADVITAVDLDADGGEELVITFIHVPEWPSYTVLYEPRAARARGILLATGHHRLAGTQDLDGDGQKELLFFGINNGFGWYNAAAAVGIEPPVNGDFELREAAPAITPDAEQSSPNERRLLWYTLLPRGFASDTTRATITATTITIPYPDGRQIRLGLDGLPEAADDRVNRRAARERAYRAARTASGLAAAGSTEQALAQIELAVRSAAQAGEGLLSEAMKVRQAGLMVAAGRLPEAESEFGLLMGASDAPVNISFSAARAFHVNGHLPDAIRWYEQSLAYASPHGERNASHELIQGLVLALAELNRWEEAREKVDRFQVAHNRSPADWSSLYREFIRWRSGAMPSLDGIELASPAIDLLRYWQLEFRHARGEKATVLLGQFDRNLEIHSPVRSMLLSLKAELLAETGRMDEAEEIAARAIDDAARDRLQHIVVRAHASLVEERHARLTRPIAFVLSNDPPVCDRQTPPGPAVQLRWTALPGVMHYDVYRDGSRTGGGVRLTGTTYNNSMALVAGKKYSYFIRATSARGTRDSNLIAVPVSADICN